MKLLDDETLLKLKNTFSGRKQFTDICNYDQLLTEQYRGWLY